MFVFDTSGSMEPVLEEAKLEIQNVIDRLRESLPNPEFGVAEVRDYGGSEYDEESFDEPWRLDLPVAGDSEAVASAIDDLYADGGGDAPEAYGRALWETDTNPDVGWRAGARHLIVLVADNVPHAPNLDEGIAEEFWLSPSPWDTGEELPGAWGIPDTQLGEGHLEFHQVLRQIAADGKPLEMVDYHDTGGDYIHYWEAWASLGGGQALEALEGGGELAGKLVGVIEHAPEDTACATAFTASPATSLPGTAPNALTPRFGGQGSRLVLTPNAGHVFCTGQNPELGDDVVGALEEDTPSQIAFRLPGEASDGLGITTLDGGESGYIGYGVDNFRYPWGFEVRNLGGGASNEYDGSLTPTAQDIDSVFAGLGPPGSPEYQEALSDAREVLGDGLCYGFALLSWGMYSDAQGGHVPLSYASSAGLSLSSLPYAFVESSSGDHALTHALLRAAVSQASPTAQQSFHKVYSAGSLENELTAPFAAGRPVPINIKFKFSPSGSLEGHTLLVYNYQAASGGGLALDVVDPNLPWSVARPSSDFQMLQVQVAANGSWSYDGSFPTPFSNSVSGGPGSLEVIPQPVDPGGLELHTLLAGDPAPIALTATSGTIEGVSYASSRSDALPSDVSPEPLATDGPENSLLVPAAHHHVTVTLGPGRSSLRISGSRFLDTVTLQGSARTVEVDTRTGAVSLPNAPSGSSVEVTSIVAGVQRTASADIAGKLHGLDLAVSTSGVITVGSTRGTGDVSLRAATYTAEGTTVVTGWQALRLHGRSRLDRRTPKPKRRKHKHHRKN